jgi:hypothetical protein
MTFFKSEPPEFTSLHRKALQDFLESETGQIALAWVAHNAPQLLDGTDVNRTLVASGEVKGFNRFLTELISLTFEQPKKSEAASETFPDLDDDSKWDKSETERPRQPK